MSAGGRQWPLRLHRPPLTRAHVSAAPHRPLRTHARVRKAVRACACGRCFWGVGRAVLQQRRVQRAPRPVNHPTHRCTKFWCEKALERLRKQQVTDIDGTSPFRGEMWIYA